MIYYGRMMMEWCIAALLMSTFYSFPKVIAYRGFVISFIFYGPVWNDPARK